MFYKAANKWTIGELLIQGNGVLCWNVVCCRFVGTSGNGSGPSRSGRPAGR